MRRTLLLIPFLAACASDDGGVEVPRDCDAFVEAGTDAQDELITALVEVREGDAVCLGAGVFDLTRQIAVTQDSITIRGAGRDETVLDFSDQLSGANGILIEGDNNIVEDLSVTGTPGDGIRANDVDGITFRRLDVGWDADASTENGAYSLYPVQSRNVVVQDCIVHGARDAGVYLGQSTNSLLENNEAYGTVIGIEAENSTDTIIRGNHSHDNTCGILAITLPGLDILDGKRANIYDNIVENNNVENFGDEGMVVGIMPRGLGILMVATDNNEVWDNEIRGNGSAGVGIVAYLPLYGFTTQNDPNYDIYSQGNYVHDNVLEDNGLDAHPNVGLLSEFVDPAPTVLVDGCVDEARGDPDGDLRNCLAIGPTDFMNVDMCGLLEEGPNNDLAPFDCVHPPLSTDSPIE